MPSISLAKPSHVLHRWESQSENKPSGFPCSCRTAVTVEMKCPRALLPSFLWSAGQVRTHTGSNVINEDHACVFGEKTPGPPCPVPQPWPHPPLDGAEQMETSRRRCLSLSPRYSPTLAESLKVFPQECLPDDNSIPFIYEANTSQGGQTPWASPSFRWMPRWQKPGCMKYRLLDNKEAFETHGLHINTYIYIWIRHLTCPFTTTVRPGTTHIINALRELTRVFIGAKKHVIYVTLGNHARTWRVPCKNKS